MLETRFEPAKLTYLLYHGNFLKSLFMYNTHHTLLLYKQCCGIN